MTEYIADISLVILAFIFTLAGFKKGFVRSFMDLVGSIFVMLLAGPLSKVLSGVIATNFYNTGTGYSGLSERATVITIFSLITVLGLFLLKRLYKAMRVVTRLPIIKQFDYILGGLFGFIEFVLFVSIICYIIVLLLPLLSNTNLNFDITYIIEKSYIFKYFYYNNPIDSIIKIVT